MLQHVQLRHEECARKVDETFLRVLVRLRKEELMKKEDVGDCVCGILYTDPSRTERRLEFLLDWDPTVFQKGIATGASIFLKFLGRCDSKLLSDHDKLERFRAILRFGLSRHPNQIGFLFHRSTDTSTSSFRSACAVLGKEKLIAHRDGGQNHFDQLF